MRSVLERPRRAGHLFVLDTTASRTALIGLITALLSIVVARHFLTKGAADGVGASENPNIEEFTE